MPLQEQAELWMALRDRMKENWAELTLHEKKAGESFRVRVTIVQSITAPTLHQVLNYELSKNQWLSIEAGPQE